MLTYFCLRIIRNLSWLILFLLLISSDKVFCTEKIQNFCFGFHNPPHIFFLLCVVDRILYFHLFEFARSQLCNLVSINQQVLGFIVHISTDIDARQIGPEILLHLFESYHFVVTHRKGLQLGHINPGYALKRLNIVFPNVQRLKKGEIDLTDFLKDLWVIVAFCIMKYVRIFKSLTFHLSMNGARPLILLPFHVPSIME